jgi:hypothetical protein
MKSTDFFTKKARQPKQGRAGRSVCNMLLDAATLVNDGDIVGALRVARCAYSALLYQVEQSIEVHL